MWCAHSHGAAGTGAHAPSHVLCCCRLGIHLAALRPAFTECQAQCHIPWALRMFLPLGTYTPVGWWVPASGYSVFNLSGIRVYVMEVEIGGLFTSLRTWVSVSWERVPLLGVNVPPGIHVSSLPGIWPQLGGSWTAGSPAVGTLKEGLGPGGHAECQYECRYVSSGCCPVGVGPTGSAAPLRGPGSPACQGWKKMLPPPCPPGLCHDTHRPALDTGHPGSPVGTHSEWGPLPPHLWAEEE